MILGKITNWLSSYLASNCDFYRYIQPADRFHEIVDRERKRADRGKYSFALIVFWVKEPENRQTIFHRLNFVLEKRLRATDVAGFVGRNRVGLLLSDASLKVGQQVAEQIFEMCGQDAPSCFDIYEYPMNYHDQVFSDRDTPEDSRPDLLEDESDLEYPVNDLYQPDKEKADRPEKEKALSDSTQFYKQVNFETTPAIAENHNHECDTQKPELKNLMFQRVMPLWKRAIDVVGSGLGLLLVSPILVATAIAMKATSKGPIFFTQMRAGIAGRPFKMYKFRTMVIDAEEQKAKLRHLSEQDGPAFKLKHDPRIIPIGRFLRKSCIDELPQLWNVFKGDMSLVGPRPLPIEEAAQIEGWQNRRLDVTPGLTCIWQVEGKSAVTFTEWMRMDIRYIRARNFAQDITLVFKTIIAVVLHRASH
ncbi:Undecaprenyl phosphate N,N'-diacetylbacillosamine 1-phosphate transferase [Polystyrenella longa]|uniref:Undecaprenyl phosphate N,N'-diacetylbacillosamine 1-phosphate transferase n=1 Tax=Polystyrenella longa TaxID=2528007 RepID=A0A518CQ11_9PLAN|nr:sugar transferase [Polystyrenella longa]QDU81306.1 Undecaprenyl phosphate N,N'-diacetylbacillosamine 1-phosphate transferase [Polystyrenella longa]